MRWVGFGSLSMNRNSDVLPGFPRRTMLPSGPRRSVGLRASSLSSSVLSHRSSPLPLTTLSRVASAAPLRHRCVTHSRNREETEGHERTRRSAILSTGGHRRNRRDTGGHEVRRVRDREAPGSNPGPPTRFCAGGGAPGPTQVVSASHGNVLGAASWFTSVSGTTETDNLEVEAAYDGATGSTCRPAFTPPPGRHRSWLMKRDGPTCMALSVATVESLYTTVCQSRGSPHHLAE